MSPRARLVRAAVAIVGLVAIAAACSYLGSWQWRRAGESRALTARFAAAAEEPALDAAPAELGDDLRFRRLAVDGRYVTEPQFLLDNRVRDGVAGYDVLTALTLADGRTLLVNRGWVEADADRSVLPEVAIDGDERAVLGQLDRLPSPGLRLGAAYAAAAARAAVIVVVSPTAQELGSLLGSRPLDYMLSLDAGEPDSFQPDAEPAVLAPERHLAYAGQWLLFALGALGAAVAIARGALRARRAAGPAP
ncbi:MAG TPA: SURF1 family protein [Gammaproteobacteria bacterium]|nr:SURF1 family protein [Gammaproteobacteria bacterium]